MSAAAIAGWMLAAALLVASLRLRRRLELVAVAAHELRGPAATIGLAAAALRREPGGLRRALAFETELERMRAGLADLDAARSGTRPAPLPAAMPLERLLRSAAAGWRPSARAVGRRVRFGWEAGPAIVRADRRRLAQAFSNLLGNAVEHGSGTVEVRGRVAGSRVRVEVRDGGSDGRSGTAGPDRGRGLGIAAQAVEEAGGSLRMERGAEGTTLAVELPLADR